MRTVFARTIGALTALLLFSTSTLLAQDRIPLEKSQKVTGTITAIQKETRQFTLKGDDGTSYIFSLDERTTIQDRGKDVRLLDMGEGVKVTVTYTPGTNIRYAVSIISEGKKGDVPMKDKPKEASPIDAEPITVKGKIENLAADLSEVTVRSFDDKVFTFQVDDDTKQRWKTKTGKIPNLSNGAEVTAVYLVQNGKNRLVTLSDLYQPEPTPGPAQNNTSPRNATSNNTTMTPNNPMNTNLTVQGAPPTTGGLYAGLPLIGGAVLPGGFVATSNNVAGSLSGTIAMVKGDMFIMSSTPNLPPNVRTSNAGNAGNANGAAGVANTTGQPAGNNFIAPRADLFAVVAINSREPFILDGSTRILSNNQNIRWQDLREGTTIQAHFNVSGDGSKVVHTIIVMDNRTGTPGAVQTNPNNRPAATDQNGNPTQPNQVNGQGGRGVPPASQFPPLPNQTGTASPANPAAGTTPATNAGNIVSGRIARLKFDSLYLQRSGNDFSFFMARNSQEALRFDNNSRVQINGQEGQFANLQVGMQVQVFVEFFNNARRVIGIVAGNQNTVQAGNRNP